MHAQMPSPAQLLCWEVLGCHDLEQRAADLRKTVIVFQDEIQEGHGLPARVAGHGVGRRAIVGCIHHEGGNLALKVG